MQKFAVKFEEKAGTAPQEREETIALTDEQLEGYLDGGAALARTTAAAKMFGKAATWRPAGTDTPDAGHVYREEKDGTQVRVSDFAWMTVTPLGK